MTIDRADLAETDFTDIDSGDAIPNTLPGDVLRQDFMEPAGITAYALARELNVPANRITAIIKGERAISAETAILFGRRFGTSAEFWMNLQTSHDLAEAGYKVGLVREAFGETAALLEKNNLDVRKSLHKQMDVVEAGKIQLRVDNRLVSLEDMLADIRRRLESVENSEKILMSRSHDKLANRE